MTRCGLGRKERVEAPDHVRDAPPARATTAIHGLHLKLGRNFRSDLCSASIFPKQLNECCNAKYDA
jgi:hypothetical protein